MQDFISHHPLVFVGGIFLWIALLWTVIIHGISFASGWRVLAQRFRLQQPYSGPRWPLQSAVMRRFASYNGALTVGADGMGMFLQPMLLFRSGHPALFIPWAEITVRHAPWQPHERVEIKLGSSEQISFRIRGVLASRLQAAAGSYWVLKPN